MRCTTPRLFASLLGIVVMGWSRPAMGQAGSHFGIGVGSVASSGTGAGTQVMAFGAVPIHGAALEARVGVAGTRWGYNEVPTPRHSLTFMADIVAAASLGRVRPYALAGVAVDAPAGTPARPGVSAGLGVSYGFGRRALFLEGRGQVFRRAYTSELTPPRAVRPVVIGFRF
jgi:hypothetical protein